MRGRRERVTERRAESGERRTSTDLSHTPLMDLVDLCTDGDDSGASWQQPQPISPSTLVAVRSVVVAPPAD